jgi:hypothetical protein
MSRYLDFLNENAQFQNMLQFDTQEKEAYDQRKEEGILGLAQITPMVPDVVKKGKEIYNKSVELYQKGQEAVSKLETNLQRGRQALESGAQRLKAVGQKGVQLVEETTERGGQLVKKAEDTINLTKDEVKNFTDKFGDRFTSELDKINSKALSFRDKLIQQNENKLKTLDEAIQRKKNDLGIFFDENDMKPFEEKRQKLIAEKESLEQKFTDYKGKLENDLKTKFTQKTQAEAETRPKSEIEPAPKVEEKLTMETEKLPARRPTTLGRVGQEDSSFIRRRTQQMGRRVAQEDFERDDIAEVMPEKRGFIDTVTGIFRGGEKAGRGAVKYSKEEMADMRAEFNRLSGGARSEMAEARFQELKGILNPKEAVQRVGAETSETLKTGEQAVKGVAKGLQRTVQGGLQEGEQMASKTVQAGKQFASETAQGLKTAGSEVLEEASTTARTAVSRGAGLASEAGELAKTTGTKALGLGLEAKEAVGETVESVGGIVGESIPVLGELAGIGLGLYDIIKGFGDKPHIYNEAKPVFTAGL